MVDRKPLINRNTTNGIAKAEGVRDQVYNDLVKACRDENVEMLILKSDPFNATVWVTIECWVPHRTVVDLTDRCAVTVTIRPREFFRFEYEMDIEFQDAARQRKISNVIEFSAAEAEQIVHYLLRKVRYEALHFKRCRAQLESAWSSDGWGLPVNKPTRLKEDPAKQLTAFGLLMLPFCGIGILPLAIAGLLNYSHSLRRSYVLSAGKPSKEPRRLIAMDSWQTLVYDLASQGDAVKLELRHELDQGRRFGFDLAPETIWYRGIDGIEERRQLVVIFRRGIGFVHVYPYGNDLYVGWDAHINCGTWVERQVGEGIDRHSGELCRVHTIEAGWHIPSEYDVTDTNCLIEWIHAAVTKVLKKMIALHHIDQEIDFKIVRGERQNIAGRNPEPETKPAEAKSRFRREG